MQYGLLGVNMTKKEEKKARLQHIFFRLFGLVNVGLLRKMNNREQAKLTRREEELDEAESLLETARKDAVAKGRGAEGAAAEARELRGVLEESRAALSAREAKARGAEKAVKVSCFC